VGRRGARGRATEDGEAKREDRGGGEEGLRGGPAHGPSISRHFYRTSKEMRLAATEDLLPFSYRNTLKDVHNRVYND
jgi:hypothetical protein